jgi:hypothetical protein
LALATAAAGRRRRRQVLLEKGQRHAAARQAAWVVAGGWCLRWHRGPRWSEPPGAPPTWFAI